MQLAFKDLVTFIREAFDEDMPPREVREQVLHAIYDECVSTFGDDVLLDESRFVLTVLATDPSINAESVIRCVNNPLHRATGTKPELWKKSDGWMYATTPDVSLSIEKSFDAVKVYVVTRPSERYEPYDLNETDEHETVLTSIFDELLAYATEEYEQRVTDYSGSTEEKRLYPNEKITFSITAQKPKSKTVKHASKNDLPNIVKRMHKIAVSVMWLTLGEKPKVMNDGQTADDIYLTSNNVRVLIEPGNDSVWVSVEWNMKQNMG